MESDYSSFQLKDRIAIVTGPSQGIGRAIALGLAKAGANLVLAEHPAMHQDELKQVKAAVETLGRQAVATLTDISKVDEVRAMVDLAVQTFGRLDILVNNAGWTCNGPALETTEEDYDKTVDSTVKGTFFACQAAARAMIPNGGGRIVNIGSNFAVSAWRGRAVYCGAKADVHQLSRRRKRSDPRPRRIVEIADAPTSAALRGDRRRFVRGVVRQRGPTSSE